jgi:hypothetical protein
LPAGAGAAVGITPEATSIEPREPPGQVVARQCFGTASSTSGPRLPSRTLTVRPLGTAPGVVTSTPSGIVCGTAAGASCAAAFPENSLVTLRVDLGSVSRFTSWGDGCESVSGAFREVCLVRLDTDRIIDAMFGSAPPPPPPPPVGEWRLTVTVDRIGAFVGSTDGSFACTASGAIPINTCAVGYPPGRVLDLYAERLPGTGVLFESWQGDCATFGAQSRIRITMDRHWNCRAAFVSGPP